MASFCWGCGTVGPIAALFGHWCSGVDEAERGTSTPPPGERWHAYEDDDDTVDEAPTLEGEHYDEDGYIELTLSTPTKAAPVETVLQTEGYVVQHAIPGLNACIIEHASWFENNSCNFTTDRGDGRHEWSNIGNGITSATASALNKAKGATRSTPRHSNPNPLIRDIWTCIGAVVLEYIRPDCPTAALLSVNAMVVHAGKDHQSLHFDAFDPHTQMQRPQTFFTVIVPLTANRAAAGGTQLFPTSHHWQGTSEKLIKRAQAQAEVDPSVTPVCGPGDIYIFNGNVVHRGLANLTLPREKEHRLFIYFVVTSPTKKDPNDS